MIVRQGPEASSDEEELPQLAARLASSGYALRTGPKLQAMAAQRVEHMSYVNALAQHLGRPTAVLVRQS